MHHHTRIRIEYFICLMLLLALVSTPALAIQWSGAGDGTTWNDPANWVGGNVPDTNTEDAEFGNSSVDLAQTVTLTASVTIDELIFSASGNRSYTLNDNGGGEQMSLRAWAGQSAGTQTLTVNSDALYTNPSDISYWSNGQLLINGGHDMSAGTGSIFLQSFNSAIIRLNSPWGTINGGNSNPLHFIGTSGASEIVVNSNPNALAENPEFSLTKVPASSLLSIASDANNAGFEISSGQTLTVRFDGRTGTAAGNRRTVESLDIYFGGTILFDADAAGSLVDGGVTLKTTRAYGSTLTSAINFGTQADAILELAPPLTDAPGTIIVNSTVTGAGKVVKSTNGTAIVQGAWTHTGGTEINGGTLRMNGGSLPNTGNLKVASGSFLDLSGNNETLGGLSGSGTVQSIGATPTLTLNEALSPGTSPGTLTITNVNLTLASGSSYVVEILNTNSYDSINLFGSLTLAVGSTLTISNLFGASVEPRDLFTIVNNDGSDPVIGTFAGLPEGALYNGYFIHYNAGLGGNDIILQAVPEPSVVLLLGIGGWLMWRRRRAANVE